MIKNQKQAAITIKRIDELKEAKSLYKLTNDPILDKLAIDSFEGLIADLEFQVSKYNSLIKGNLYCIKPTSLENISDVLIEARLAQKISQRELAELLGIKEQQIQRYEATDYETAAWPRIIEVATALNLKFGFDRIMIVNDNQDDTFTYPPGITKEQVELAEVQIKEKHSFIFNV